MLKGAMLLFGNPKLGSHTAANVGAGVDVGDRGAQIAERGERLLERLLDLGVDALEEVRARHADTEPADPLAQRYQVVGDGLAARRRIGRVVAGERLEE